MHDGSDNTRDGIYQASFAPTAGANLPFDAGTDFGKLAVTTSENPTAAFEDVVEDLVYWAGNDVSTGSYIKSSPKTGGTSQTTSLSKFQMTI